MTGDTEGQPLLWSRRERTSDLTVALALFVLSFSIGDWFTTHWGGRAEFYQKSFGPAVSLTCGHGFANPNYESPHLNEFLYAERDTYQCTDLLPVKRVEGLNGLQSALRYLMGSVVAVWRLRGMSWSVLGPLYGVLFAIVIVSAYGIFRICVRRTIAVALAVLFATSPMHLMNLPHLRDYGKAPFIVLSTFILMLLAALPLRPRRLLILAATYGVVLGIGIGFRIDLEIMLPPFIGVVVCFLPAPLRSRWPLRLGAIAAFFVAFVVAGWPILSNQGTRGGWFVADHGLMEPFDEILEVGNDTYGRGHMYHDTFIGMEIVEFSRRAYGNQELAILGTAVLEKATWQYFLQTAKAFPADMLVRAYASSLKILDLPFEPPNYRYTIAWQFARPEDVRIDSRIVAAALRVRERVMTSFHRTGFWFVFVAVFLLRRRPRLALFAMTGILYLTTYPFLQFHPRHYFHLEFVGLWGIGCAVEALAGLRRGGTPVRPLLRDALRFAMLVAIVFLVPLAAARLLQKRILTRLFDAYLHAQSTNILTAPRRLSEGRVMFPSPEQWPASHFFHYLPPTEKEVRAVSSMMVGERPEEKYHTELLRLTFDAHAARDAVLSITLRYTTDLSKNPVGYEPTLRMDVPLRSANSERVEVIVPIHEITTFSHFEGIEMSAAQAPALAAVQRIDDPNAFPIMVRAILPNDWRERPLYQRLLYWTPNAVAAIAENASRPQIVLNQAVNDWILLGYDAPPSLIDDRSYSGVVLHWLAPRDAKVAASSTLQHVAGARWRQIVPSLRNLVKDGGFERDATVQAFPEDIYQNDPRHAPAKYRRLIADQGSHGAVASLAHDAYSQRSSFATTLISVQDDHFYLQSADVRCSVCNATVARKWMQSGAYSFVVTQANPSRWATYASMTRPLPGSDAVQLWLLDNDSVGRADFDDVAFVDLGRVMRSAGSTAPPLEVAAPSPPRPQFALRQFLEGWELRGYDADARALADGQRTDVRLHWIAPPDVNPIPDGDLRPCGGRCWLQTIHGLTNRIPTAALATGDLSFFPTNPYGPPHQGVTARLSSNGRPVIDLANSAALRRTGLVSDAIALDANGVYLQTGAFSGAPDARIYYGRVFQPSQSSSYVRESAGSAPREETRVGEVFRVPEGATHAQVWLLNLDATGPAHATDLAFAEIGRIVKCASVRCGPPVAPAVTAAESRLPPPEVPMDMELNGWRLLGVDPGPSTITLHWRAPAGISVTAAPPGAERVADTNRWMQRIAAHDMIGNRIAAGDGPLLFANQIYDEGMATREFVGSGAETVLRLHSDATHPRTSFASLALPVSPKHLYLQFGYVRSPKGDAYLGRVWQPGDRISYAAAGVKPSAWTPYVQAVVAPADATAVSIWLLNLAPSSTAEFRGLMFIDAGATAAAVDAFPVTPAKQVWPDHWLNGTLGGWSVCGYSESPMRIFLIPPPNASVRAGSGLSSAGNGMWMQRTSMERNLVTNGDFANGTASFTGDLYGSAAATQSIEASVGGRMGVATLRNDATHRRSSLVSDGFGVDERHAYLQTGWMRASNAAAYAGRQWQPGGASSYALRELGAAGWSRFAQLLTPPAGSNGASVWLLNVDSAGTAFFDDVRFLDLGPIDPAACAPGAKGTVCSAPFKASPK